MSESILDIPTEQLTPGMRQYQDAKKQNPDCIILLRMGDFYELFYEDAVVAAKELDITLTARGKGEKRAPLAGVPYHALENYLARLVKKGYKVGIVEQLEDPKQAKGLVKRGLVRIVTPGTVIDSSMLNEKENNFIIALSCYKEEYAIACCDLSTGEFFTRKVENFNELLSEITRLNPSECIIPESLQVNKNLVKEVKKNCFLNSFEDYYFKTDKAREVLLQHFQLRTLDSFSLEDKPLNLAVSGALMNYLVETQKNSLSHLKKISLQSNRNKMLLDSSTLRNLELIRNIKDGSLRGTLFSVLDKTVTAMGSRLLKKWIKEPLLNKEILNKRLDAITELNRSVIKREEIIALLENVYDLERLISRVNYGNASPRDLLALRNSLQQIPLIKNKLTDSGLLGEIKQISYPDKIVKLIGNAIHQEAPIKIREGGIIKNGYNEKLDNLRDIKRNSKAYLQQIEEREREKTGIQKLKIGYTRVFGYFIEITKRNLDLVPKDYIRKQTTANSERYITEELKLEEEKILGAEEKIVELEYQLFQDLIMKISLETTLIQEAALRLAVLDVICSLAKAAMENAYTKPKFIDENVIQLAKSRHPVLEMIEERFIANDVFVDSGEMMIITGANMSGKSSLMRQVALIVLMAQIGSYVPCSDAVLGITDRIFTRVGAQDDLSSGQSTFMVEMNETASILHNATSNSLIILDEIGRGTSTFDGVSIAWSVAEHIYNTIKAKTLFSTHYHVMNKLAEKFSRIRNYYLATKEVKNEVVFLYKLLEGGADQSFGIHVAKLAGLPYEVVERAKEIQKLLEKDDEMMRKMQAKKLKEQMSLERF